jgi:acyl carrier protein
MEDLRDRVSRVIAEQFHVANERIVEAATLDEDLGATSLDRVEVVMSLEDEFKIDISDDQALRLHTVADVLACVEASVGKASVGKGSATAASRAI